MGLISLALGFYFWQAGSPVWQTVIFTTLTFSQVFLALAVRSERDSIFEIGLLSNIANLGAVLLTFALQLAVVYLPFLQGVFRTLPLSPGELALCFVLGSLPLWATEIEKRFLRRAPAAREPLRSS
jgi:Ca2+-transporting ATPase